MYEVRIGAGGYTGDGGQGQSSPIRGPNVDNVCAHTRTYHHDMSKYGLTRSLSVQGTKYKASCFYHNSTVNRNAYDTKNV